jgi:quinol monooxygenase YgiN
MYGIIGKIRTQTNARDTVIAILLDATREMPGCLSYVIARDPADPDALWVTEAWVSRDHHRASLTLPVVQHAIAQAKPLITGFGERFETEPVGGHGLTAATPD